MTTSSNRTDNGQIHTTCTHTYKNVFMCIYKGTCMYNMYIYIQMWWCEGLTCAIYNCRESLNTFSNNLALLNLNNVSK